MTVIFYMKLFITNALSQIEIICKHVAIYDLISLENYYITSAMISKFAHMLFILLTMIYLHRVFVFFAEIKESILLSRLYWACNCPEIANKFSLQIHHIFPQINILIHINESYRKSHQKTVWMKFYLFFFN